MRNVVIWSVVLLVMTGSACDKDYRPPKTSWPKGVPKELALDLGNGVKLEMVLIPAGEFMMGARDVDRDTDDNEKPRHRVRITTKPFYLGKYLVTFAPLPC
jgi:formylglycine-generating enzyme required for sulfatase activity